MIYISCTCHELFFTYSKICWSSSLLLLHLLKLIFWNIEYYIHKCNYKYILNAYLIKNCFFSINQTQKLFCRLLKTFKLLKRSLVVIFKILVYLGKLCFNYIRCLDLWIKPILSFNFVAEIFTPNIRQFYIKPLASNIIQYIYYEWDIYMYNKY